MKHLKELLKSHKDLKHAFLTIQEAAQVLDCAVPTVRRYIEEGKLIALPSLGKNKVIIPAFSVVKLLAELDAERSKKRVNVH